MPDRLVAQRMGRLDLMMISGDPQEMVRTQQQITSGDGQALLLILQIEGSSSVEQEERVARLMPGDMTLIDWARPSRVCFEHGFRVLVLCLAHASVTARLGERSLPPATRLDGQSGVGALLGSYLRALRDQAERLDGTSAGVAAEHVVAMLSLAFGQQPVPPDEPPPHLARLQLVPLYTDDLAESALSPERVAEANRRHGVPPREYRRTAQPEEHPVNLTAEHTRLAA